MNRRLILFIFSLLAVLDFGVNFASQQGSPVASPVSSPPGTPRGGQATASAPELPVAPASGGWSDWKNKLYNFFFQGAKQGYEIGQEGAGLVGQTARDIGSYGYQKGASAATYVGEQAGRVGQGISDTTVSAVQGLQTVGMRTAQQAQWAAGAARQTVKTVGSYPIGATAFISGAVKGIGAFSGEQTPPFTALMASNFLLGTAAIEAILGAYNYYSSDDSIEKKKLEIKNVIAILLNDPFTYPTMQTKLNALIHRNEFLITMNDKDGIAEQACKELMQELDATLSEDEDVSEADKAINLAIDAEKYKLFLLGLDLDGQIKNLEEDQEIIEIYQLLAKPTIRAKLSLLSRLNHQKLVERYYPGTFTVRKPLAQEKAKAIATRSQMSPEEWQNYLKAKKGE